MNDSNKNTSFEMCRFGRLVESPDLKFVRDYYKFEGYRDWQLVNEQYFTSLQEAQTALAKMASYTKPGESCEFKIFEVKNYQSITQLQQSSFYERDLTIEDDDCCKSDPVCNEPIKGY